MKQNTIHNKLLESWSLALVYLNNVKPLKMLILVILLSLSCCNTAHSILIKDCGELQAKKVVEDYFDKHGNDILKLQRTITDTFGAYYISYIPIDLKSLGGGAEIRISKLNCNIIECKFNQ